MATAKKSIQNSTKSTKTSRTIQPKKKLNAKFAAVILLVAAIGGYFLYTSHAAYPREWVPGGSSSPYGTVDSNCSSCYKSKSNGTRFWQSSAAGHTTSVTITHLTPNKTYCVDFELSGNSGVSTSWGASSSSDVIAQPNPWPFSLNGNMRTSCINTRSTIAGVNDWLKMRVTATKGSVTVWRYYQR